MNRRVITYLAISVLCIALAFVLHGCAAGPFIGAGAGGAALLATAEYLEGSAITEEALQFVGDEAAKWALSKIPVADQPKAATDCVAACQDMITYLQTGQVPSAAIINTGSGEK